MIEFTKHLLSNGLRLVIHEDHTLPTAVLNVLYDVGARDEDPGKTGFAHLFEHLMFGGSVNIPVYDEPLQRVGGENNAFTSNDVTNYYIQLPSVNLETAFWLESDRMMDLAFSEKSLDVQRSVVIEEFKQRYLNQPYGDVWLKLRPLAYKEHPYRWATIGKEISHIEHARIEDVKAFFRLHYSPLNAVLVVAGNVESKEVIALAEKWFGSIKPGERYTRHLPKEPPQTAVREETVLGDVPQNALYMAFHIAGRMDPDYYATDLLADILSQGHSSRLYRRLLKDQKLFSEIHAYQTSDMDPGLLVIEGKINSGVDLAVAEKAVWNELEELKSAPVPDDELTKVKNKVESTLVFSEMNLLEKAINLAYFEVMGDANGVNRQHEQYLDVTAGKIKTLAAHVFRPQNVSVLKYLARA